MEELIKMDNLLIRAACYHIIDIIDYYELMARTPDCNNCGKKNDCEHAPEPGQQVRSNCFLWEGEE